MYFKYKNILFFPFLGIIIFCLPLSACFKNIPDRVIVYENNFEGTENSGLEIKGSNGIVDSLKKFKFNDTYVFGRFKDNAVILNLKQIPTHNIIKIEFDLYLHDDWKGNFIAPNTTVPDIWQMKLDNNPIYVTTFSNGSIDQSFPNNYQTVLIKNKAFSNAWGKFSGVCSKADKSDGTSYYKMEYLSGHKASSIELLFQDVSFVQSTQCTKSWSIDNLRITSINQL
ncbi:MAG: hypothetical protein RL108_2084 [Bacteroidota bacterium]|jgi:hypothetical protein